MWSSLIILASTYIISIFQQLPKIPPSNNFSRTVTFQSTSVYSQAKVPLASRMDQANPEAQAPNGAQPSREIQQPREAQRSPLGHLLSQGSVDSLAKDPLQWHLKYWLNIWTVALLRGEKPLPMLSWIDLEHDKTPDRELKLKLQNAWDQHLIDNSETYSRHWTLLTLESPAAKAYLRDIDRLLVNAKTASLREKIVWSPSWREPKGSQPKRDSGAFGGGMAQTAGRNSQKSKQLSSSGTVSSLVCKDFSINSFYSHLARSCWKLLRMQSI